MMTKLIKSTSTSVSTWMAWKRLRLVRRPNGRAEVRISVLTESSDTSRKCARQFLCNRSVVARKREKKKIHTQTSQVVFPFRQARNRLFLGSPSSAACACITGTRRRVDTFTLCERPHGIRRTTEKVVILAAARRARSHLHTYCFGLTV